MESKTNIMFCMFKVVLEYVRCCSSRLCEYIPVGHAFDFS